MIGKFGYHVLRMLARVVMFFWHPVFRVYGRENVPEEGPFLICPNHSGLADPIWVIFALKLASMPRFMAKKEVMEVPVLGRILRWLGGFGVDRSGGDVNAVKTALKCLKNGQSLMLFPEGTRVKNGKNVKAKGGAVLLSHKTGAQILPVFLSPRKYPFCPITCVIGSPCIPVFHTPKPCEDELLAEADRIMKEIYDLGERK